MYHAKEKEELNAFLRKELLTHNEDFIFIDEITGEKLFIQNQQAGGRE